MFIPSIQKYLSCYILQNKFSYQMTLIVQLLTKRINITKASLTNKLLFPYLNEIFEIFFYLLNEIVISMYLF